MSFRQLEGKREVQPPSEWRPNLSAFYLSPKVGEGPGEWGWFMTSSATFNYLEWAPRDAFEQADFAQGGWSRRFRLGLYRATSPLL